jgi:hypothetical protein
MGFIDEQTCCDELQDFEDKKHAHDRGTLDAAVQRSPAL